MKSVMCRSCGQFEPAMMDENGWIPITDACPKCDGTEFKDNDSGRTLTTEKV